MTRPVERLWGPHLLGEREELLIEAERIGHVGTWAWDMRTGAVAWSEELYRILGRTQGVDEATFDNFIASIHADDRELVADLSRRAAQGDVAERADFRVQRPDRSLRDVMGLAQVFNDAAGMPQHMVGAIIDLTERKLLEEQLVQAQKMEALGRLAGGIAHDFNNLLTVILLNVQMFRSSNGARGRLDIVHDAASAAAALTAQLLAFSRRSPQPPVPVDVNAVVVRTQKLLERVIGEDIKVTFTAATEAPTVLAPDGQLEQVLMNLALNARDAMLSGGELTIRTAVEMHAGRRYVRLSVADTGAGMDPKTRERIFEPFFTTKDPGKGTGLGLATVFGIVTPCGGKVEVESEPDRGATFHVLLPCADIRASVSAHGVATTQAGKGTVLLVEDDAAVLGTVANVLRDAGYEVVAADRPSVALEMWAEHRSRIEMLLSDVVMPELDGRQLAARLLEDAPKLPILLMTGHDPGLGPDEPAFPHPMIAKPFTPDELVTAVATALERRDV